MTADQARNYSMTLFDRVGLDIDAWWRIYDPYLEGKPARLALQQPRVVIQRAEYLADLAQDTEVAA